MTVLALADRQAFGIAAAHVDDRLRYKRVINDRVGFHQHTLCPKRQQVFCAWAGTDQPDLALGLSRGRQKHIGGATGGGMVVCFYRIGDIAQEEAAPENATGNTARNETFRCVAVIGSKVCEATERRRQHLVDAGADHLRKNRACTFGTDGDGDRCTVDEGRGEKVAIVGLVHGIGRDFLRTRGGDDCLILLGFTGCGENQYGTL
ncbi:hypothetical protein D3C80_978670 [compost metagenome]